MKRKQLLSVVSLPAVALALSLSGCVDEKIVYRDRELWEQPPAAAVGFLGYSKAEEKLTVCGNCHMGQQGAWQETAHAGAWESLQGSGHAAATCEGCHTASELGNLVEVVAGYNTTKDPRYEDVQCESCHGPGLEHVSNPSKGTIESVLAPVMTGMSLKTGCIECHNGTHHPYGEEWAASMHGKAAANSAASRAECQECHTAEDALVKFGLTKVYQEKGEYFGSLTKNMPITCTVCHDPHDDHYAGQLRKSVSEADLTKNLCMKCHYKRGIPDPTTYRGAHSPEGPLVVGDGGWWSDTMKAAFKSGRVDATHGSPAANPELCAGCHMNRFDYKDAAGVTINGTGHTFEAIPCVDGNGAPIVNGTCTTDQRTYKSCTAAGCHGSEAVARSAVTTSQLRVANLVAELDRTLQKVHADWKTCRSKVPPAAGSCGGTTGTFNGKPTFNTADALFTTAEGAAFNHDMGARVTAVIHNPLLVEALLITSIQQVKKDYGVTTPMTVDLTPQFKQH